MDDLHYKGKGCQEGSKTESALIVIFSYIKKAIIEINSTNPQNILQIKNIFEILFNDSTAIAQLAVSLCVSLNVSPITTIVRCH